MAKTLIEFYLSLPRASAKHSGAPGIDVGVDLDALRAFESECETREPPIKGNRGDDLYKLVARGRDKAIPEATLRDTITRLFLPRIAEQHGLSGELEQVLRNVELHAKGEKGAGLLAAKFQNFAPEIQSLQALSEPAIQIDVVPDAASSSDLQQARIRNTFIPTDLQLENNKIKSSISNMMFYLNSDEWSEAFRLNDFTGRIEFVLKPFWREGNLVSGCELGKEDGTLIKAWFSRNCNFEVNREAVWTAAFTLAATRRHHPLREWLFDIVWDGIPRLDRILNDTMGAEDCGDGYIQEIGKNLVMSAVMRVIKPGCKQDHVMVIEGKQGVEKSKWIEELGGKYSAVGALVQGSKDNYICLKGKWFVELPEINATFTKQHFAWLKGIISTASDTYRPLYAESAETVPRESIFIATLNPNATNQYLKDDENRRYWPVKALKLNLPKLRELREQYFAEAMNRLHDATKAGEGHPDGEAWWITDPKLILAARKAQEARRDQDPWVELLSEWLAAREGSGFSTHDVFGALGKTSGDVKSWDRTRLYAMLQDDGWTAARQGRGSVMWTKELDWESLK